MSSGRPIAELVDELLAAQKEFTGDPEPRRPNREAEQARLVWPVLARGETAECYVAMTLYPEDQELRFTICLVYRDHNVWRLCYEPMDRPEHNPYLHGDPYSGATIWGPHCHRWWENRQFATHGSIPDPLPYRVPLDEKIRTWESAFRHFAGEANIDQPENVPVWPPRGRLL